jgi:predicted adenine nucleotide alpha hydrolase (AANH) superfamily ATPase
MKIVLHICCGICAAGVVERLQAEGHEVTGFFYNPNIHPPTEYEKRLEVARKVAGEFRIPLEVPPYDPGEWYEIAGGMGNEPEDGDRCVVCYRLRLARTVRFLADTGADAFTTTLTISPRKKADIVNRVGQEVGKAFPGPGL